MIKSGVIVFLINATALLPFGDNEVVKVSVPKVVIQRAEEGVVSVYADVKPGYHIQAHEVKDEYLVPTTLEITGTKDIVPGRQVFPSTKKFKLEGTDSFLEVFDGKFEIQTFLTAPRKIQKGKYTLNGKLKYQACDSVRCYFPKSIDFSVDVEIK